MESILAENIRTYVSYCISTARYDQGIRAARWAIRFLENLREDPGRGSYFDKIISLFYLSLAFLQDGWQGPAGGIGRKPAHSGPDGRGL